MNESRLERLAPLTGVISVVLFFAAAGMYGFYEYYPAAEKLQSFFNEHSTRLYYSGYLGILSAFFLMWFAGSLYKTVRQIEGGEGRLALVAFGGCIAASLGVALAYTALPIIAGLVREEGGIGPIEAVLLNLQYGNFLVVAGFPIAVLIGATSVVSLRTSMFPKWFGWVGVVITIGLLTPEGWIIIAPAMIWLFAVSIWLYRRGMARA
jgi:hypothetical protein